MTHYAVGVIVPTHDLPDLDLDEVIGELLAPYQEPDGWDEDALLDRWGRTADPTRWDWYEVGGRFTNWCPRTSDSRLLPGVSCRVHEYLAQSGPILYALCTTTGWQTQGIMGWWGMSQDLLTDTEWRTRFLAELAIHREDILVVVDCHI